MAIGERTRRDAAPSPAALSPWPEDGPGRLEAIARLRQAVSGRTLDSDEAANHLGMVASAMVERYAPGAPQVIRDEATIRAAGYLAQSDFGTVGKESGLPGHDVEYVTNHASLFRNSGSAALLTNWKIRRAGKI